MFKQVLVLAYFVLFFLGGILFFVGFFGEKTSVGQANHINDARLLEIDFFDVEKIYDKVVYFIVDALRVDYLNIETRSPSEQIHNRLENLNALMKSPELRKHIRFFNFKADFPTFTAFRVRSLMSGENPGLMNIIKAITPDNKENSPTILRNMYNQNKKCVIIGDETWDLLYRRLIHHNYRYGSLDIRNFHDLDNYVLESSNKFLNSANKDYHKYNDWSLMIMHFIGVDHVGHYLGVHNHFMKEKLSQMDKEARRSIQMLLKIDHDKDMTPTQFAHQIQEFIQQGNTSSERILFLFFGDHGQTDAGGHGGSSIMEYSAGFFAFSTTPFMDPMEDVPHWKDGNSSGGVKSENGSSGPIDFSERVKGIKVLNQIDIVPIISSALGVSIPENNLGIFRRDFITEVRKGRGGGTGSRQGDDGYHYREKMSEYEQEKTYAKIMHNNALQMFKRLLALVGSFSILEEGIISRYYEFGKSYELLRETDRRVTNGIKNAETFGEDYESLIRICKEHYELSHQFAEFLQGKLFKDRSEFDWWSSIQGFVILLSLLVFMLAASIPSFNFSVSRFMFNHKKGFLSLSPASNESSPGHHSAKNTVSPSTGQSLVPGSFSFATGPLFAFYLILIMLLSVASLVGLYLSSRRVLISNVITRLNGLTSVVTALVMIHVLVRFRQELRSFYFNIYAMIISSKESRWNLYWCVLVLACVLIFGSYSSAFARNGDIVVRFLLASYQIVLLFSGSKRNLRQMLLPIIQLVLIRFTFTFGGESPVLPWPFLKSSTTGFTALMVYLLLLVLVYRDVLNKWNIFFICVAPVYVWFNWTENNNMMRLFGLLLLVYLLRSVFLRVRRGCCRAKSKESPSSSGSSTATITETKTILNRWISNQLVLSFLLKNEMLLPFAVTSVIQLISVESLRKDYDHHHHSHAREVSIVKSMESIILLFLLSLNNFFNLGNQLKLDSIPEYIGLIGLDYFHPIMSHFLVVYFLTSHFFSLSSLLKLPFIGLKSPRAVIMGIFLANFLFSLVGVVILRENILVWQILSPKLIYEFVFGLSFSLYSLY